MAKAKLLGDNLEYKIGGNAGYVLAEAGAINGNYDKSEFFRMLDRASFDDIKSKRRKKKLENKRENIKDAIGDYPDDIQVTNFAEDHTSLMVKKRTMNFNRRYFKVATPFMIYLAVICGGEMMANHYGRAATWQRIQAYHLKDEGKIAEAEELMHSARIKSDKEEKWENFSEKLDFLGILH